VRQLRPPVFRCVSWSSFLLLPIYPVFYRLCTIGLGHQHHAFRFAVGEDALVAVAIGRDIRAGPVRRTIVKFADDHTAVCRFVCTNAGGYAFIEIADIGIFVGMDQCAEAVARPFSISPK